MSAGTLGSRGGSPRRAGRATPHGATQGRLPRSARASARGMRLAAGERWRMEHRSRVPEPGDVLGGKYRVDAIVGRGGMSVVYRATHLDLDRQVALKVLSPDALRVPEYVARLKHEARAVARIRSEHVVRV